MELFDSPVHFELNEVLCYGVEKKWGKYNIPVCVDEKTKQSLEDLAKVHDCKNPVHGIKTLYLKSEGLSGKQKLDLLDQGKNLIDVKFDCEGVFSSYRDESKYLVFKVVKLRKSDKEVEIQVPEDW